MQSRKVDLPHCFSGEVIKSMGECSKSCGSLGGLMKYVWMIHSAIESDYSSLKITKRCRVDLKSLSSSVSCNSSGQGSSLNRG
jgi:hypothetical protein